MPWHIVQDHSECGPGQWAVVKDDDGSVAGCHDSEAAARRQLAALYAGESGSREKGNKMAVAAERRFTPLTVELRAKDELRIGGYAATFGKESKNLGGFVERLDPAVFNASRGDGWPDVLARYNHSDNMLLGTTGSGTLRLSVDDTGLDYEVDLPQSRADIAELVARGDVRKSSFAFRTIEDTWDTTDQGFPRRSLLKAQLVDVAPVNMPAYVDTSAGLRSLAEQMEADLEEVRSLAEANELHRFFVRTDNRGRPKPKPTTLGAAARMELLNRETDPYADQ